MPCPYTWGLQHARLGFRCRPASGRKQYAPNMGVRFKGLGSVLGARGSWDPDFPHEAARSNARRRDGTPVVRAYRPIRVLGPLIRHLRCAEDGPGCSRKPVFFPLIH